MKCPKCGYNSFEHHDACKKCANDLTAYKATFGLKAIVLPLEARTSMAEALKAEAAPADEAPKAAERTGDMFSFDLPEGEPAGPAASPAPGDNPFNFGEEPEAANGSGFGDFSFDEPSGAQPQGFAEFSLDESAPAQPSGLGDFSLDEPAPDQPQELGDFSFDVPAATQSGEDDPSSVNEEQKAAQVKAEEDAFASLLGASSQDDAVIAAPEAAPSGTHVEFDLESFSWDDTPAPAAPAEETGTKGDDDLSSLFGGPEETDKK